MMVWAYMQQMSKYHASHYAHVPVIRQRTHLHCISNKPYTCSIQTRDLIGQKLQSSEPPTPHETITKQSIGWTVSV